MGTKFKIGEETLDIPRGINFPVVGDGIDLKHKGETKQYVVDSIIHVLDYDISIKQGNTFINLKEI
jgi:hypothetical protein